MFAHGVVDPGSGSALGNSGAGLGMDDPDGMPLDQRGEDEQVRVWLEKIEETYGYQYDWRFGEYEIEHDDDDRYDDEYEHEDFLDPA